jgi:predicted transposase YdaD
MIDLKQLKDSSIYQHILQEGRQEGRQEGWQEGRQEGRQEGLVLGKLEGVRETLNRLIGKRFPSLELASQINQIDNIDALEQLILDLFELADADAVHKRVLELVG